MANPLGGQIGYNIWNASENGEKSLNLGMVGHAASLDNAAAAEVRGSLSKFDLNNPDMDIDYYQATASWYRQAFANKPDTTPVSGHIDLSVRVGQTEVAGVLMSVYDAFGRVVFSEFDFVFSNAARSSFGEDNFKMLEDIDADFIGSTNKYGKMAEATWEFPTISGIKANTFVVGITGFTLDVETGSFNSLGYTMQWGFN